MIEPGRRSNRHESALQIRVDHFVERLILHAEDQVIAGDAGVVDQHIDPAMLVGDLLDGGGKGFASAISQTTGSADSAFGGDFCADLLEVFQIARDGHHMQPVLGQPPDDRRADPARSAGYYCDTLVCHDDSVCIDRDERGFR